MADMKQHARKIFDSVEMPPLIGTLADLPDHAKQVVEAYGRACVREAIAAALRDAPEWQPMETAPHTGVAVLLWQPWKSGRDCAVIGHYANGWCWRDNEEMQPEPTHWMPLPASPLAARPQGVR